MNKNFMTGQFWLLDSGASHHFTSNINHFFFLNLLECIEAVCLTLHYTIAYLTYLGPFGQSLHGVQAHTFVPASQYCPPHLMMGGGLLCDFCLEFYIDAQSITLPHIRT